MSKNNTAFVFPGQGSQSLGMLADLSVNFSIIRETFDEASNELGRDLWAIAQEGPLDVINQTQNTQPIVLVASVALWRLIHNEVPLEPVVLAGHSLGEYTALVCAKSLAFLDAVKLVEQRATFMQQAVPVGEGAMAAILGLDVDKLVSICGAAANNEVVSAVNFNAPGQVVIAGNSAAVNRAIEMAKAEGAKRALLLPVSVPSHCELMLPAANKLESTLKVIEINPPANAIIHNTDVSVHGDESSIKKALVKQLHTPVRWTETIEAFSKFDVTSVIECGPGKVLTGLNKRIDKTLDLYSMGDERSLTKTLEELS